MSKTEPEVVLSSKPNRFCIVLEDLKQKTCTKLIVLKCPKTQREYHSNTESINIYSRPPGQCDQSGRHGQNLRRETRIGRHAMAPCRHVTRAGKPTYFSRIEPIAIPGRTVDCSPD